MRIKSFKIKKASLMAVLVLVLAVVFAQLAIAETGTPSKSRVHENIFEFSWTMGEPFPVVDGHTIFPPIPPSLASTFSTGYNTHWYAGSVYPSYAAQDARTIAMSIMVPSYFPPRTYDYFYVLLSAWDDNGSYDQIGFSTYMNEWGLTYSWTSGPPDHLTFYASPNAMDLSPGVTYTFYITTESGVTSFIVYQGSTKVWSLENQPTGGNYLILSHSYSGYLNYTDYEEIWGTYSIGGSPEFDPYFDNNYWISSDNSSNASTWNDFKQSAPSNVSVEISGDNVLVENPRATLSISPSSQGWFPGATLSYNVTVKNICENIDNFDLTVSDNADWGPTVSQTPLLNVSLGETRVVTLTVKIPDNAIPGTSDNIIVTATSQADNTVSDNASCIALVALVGVNVVISPNSQFGDNGATLTYTVTVTDTGNIIDNYNLTASDNQGWNPTLSDNKLDNITPSGNKTTTLTITVPGSVTQYTEDNITVTATSQDNTTVNDNNNCIARAPIWTGTPTIHLENLYKVGIVNDLQLNTGSKLVVKFSKYDSTFQAESVIDSITPPQSVIANENVPQPVGTVQIARLVLTGDSTDNIISIIASFTVHQSDLRARNLAILRAWSGHLEQQSAFKSEVMGILRQWSSAPA